MRLACSHVNEFNNRNKLLTSKLLKQGHRYLKRHEAFSTFYYPHSELIVKYNICLKTLLSEAVIYGVLFINLKELLEILILVINFKRFFNVIKE